MEVFGLPATQATLFSASARGESLLRSCRPIPDPTRRAFSVCMRTEIAVSGSEAVSDWQKEPRGMCPSQKSPTSRRERWYMPLHGTPEATYGSRCGEATRAEESCDCEMVIGPIFATVCISRNTAAAFCMEIRWGGFGWDSKMGKWQCVRMKSFTSILRRTVFPAVRCWQLRETGQEIFGSAAKAG